MADQGSLVVKQAIICSCKSRSIHYWNQPVLSNKSKVSCSMKQLGPLMGLKLTTGRYPAITSQMRHPMCHARWTGVETFSESPLVLIIVGYGKLRNLRSYNNPNSKSWRVRYCYINSMYHSLKSTCLDQSKWHFLVVY